MTVEAVVTQVAFRDEVTEADKRSVRDIVESTGFFRADEVKVAVELVDERLAKGVASGYHFLFAEVDGRTVGYACFGPIACTVHSYDEFWIAVHRDYRGLGVGRRLQEMTERRVAQLGGKRIYIETSSRDQYEPTRAFYRACGYRVEAVLNDFYDSGDGKVVLLKVL
jgi:D-alanine-D-alanine ligase